MNRFTFIAIVLLIAMSTAGYAITKTTTWDFNDGLQGWTVGLGPWPGGNPPTAGGLGTVDFTDTPDGVYNIEHYTSQGLYLPDKHYAYKQITATNSFTYKSLVVFEAGNVNRLAEAGLGFRVASWPENPPNDNIWNVSFSFQGKGAGNSDLRWHDYAGANTNIDQPGCIKALLSLGPPATSYQPVEGAVWMTIDYNHSQAGKIVLSFQAENYRSWIESGSQSPYPASSTGVTFNATSAISIDPLTSTYYTVDSLRLGGDNSWSQFYADNTSLTDYNAIPEPGSLLALGTGLIGLLGLIRRRK